jgi:RNA polymerase sigma factor (sigma-70 family)
MPELDDIALLREFATTESETAFAALVQRHVNLVYGTALRRTADPHAAEEITQAVFILLARKARSLGAGTVLAGWLYHAARLTAANFIRNETRRQRREREAYMQSLLTSPETPPQTTPLLDDALARLGERDRNAIVLRFFEANSLGDVGAALGVSEDAARVRVNRALGRLREFFKKRGVTLSATALAGALAATSMQAAPTGLAATVVAVSLKGLATGSLTAVLVERTLATLFWARYKVPFAVATAVLVTGAALVAFRPHSNAVPPPTAGAAALEAPVSTEMRPPVLREPLTQAALLTLSIPPGAVVVQPDGRILAGTTLGGWFVDEQSGTLGWYTRGMLRFEADGTLDRSFLCDVGRPGGTSAMSAHVGLQNDGRIFLSGFFDAVDGKPRPGYAMLLADGDLDESFEPWRGRTNVPGRPYLPGGTFPAALLGDGSVAVLCGAIEGPRAPYPWTVYRLDASGRLIPEEHANSPASEFSRPSGLVLTLGPVGFWARKPVDWNRTTPASRRTFRFSPGTEPPVADLPFEACTEPPSAVDAAPVLEALFDEVPMELCRYAVRLPDGGAILAVRDEVVDGSTKARGRLMRFDKDWRPDFSFTNRYEADLRSCLALKLQADGRLLVAGLVGTLNGENFPGVVRLERDGAMDRSFRCETGDSLGGRVMDMALQADRRIVIGGFFAKVNGIACPYLARLDPDGSLDQTFRTPFVFGQEFMRRRQVRVHHLARATEAPATATGTNAAPGAASVADTVFITEMNLDSAGASIRFSGKPGQFYILQARPALGNAEWSNVSTNQAAANGSGVLRDPEAQQHPMSFYRVAQP